MEVSASEVSGAGRLELAGLSRRNGVICFFVEFCQRFVGLADAGFGECGD